MTEYLSLVAQSGQVNTPPGSYATVKEWARHSFMRPESQVLELGCSVGFIATELTRYTGAMTLGIDLNVESIRVACQNVRSEPGRRPTFLVADAGSLPFADHSFSHVVVGGHLPFMPHDQRRLHIEEAYRVLQPFGFLLTALYFYHTPPPADLIEEFNEEIGTQLRPEYDHRYWVSLFDHSGLELELESVYDFSLPDESRIRQYVDQLRPTTRLRWGHRLRLFSENGKNMHYFVRVYRKFAADATLHQVPRGGIYADARLISRTEK